MKTLLTLTALLLLTACASTNSNSTYRAGRYIAATTDNTVAEWRKREGIPPNALIAVSGTGQVAIVENPTRVRYIGPSMNTYVNDFVSCYINMEGTYLGRPVTLQAPCDRDPERFRRFGMGSGFGYGTSIGVGVGTGRRVFGGAGIGFGF